MLLIFAVDLGILYTIYAVSRRRTAKRRGSHRRSALTRCLTGALSRAAPQRGICATSRRPDPPRRARSSSRRTPRAQAGFAVSPTTSRHAAVEYDSRHADALRAGRGRSRRARRNSRGSYRARRASGSGPRHRSHTASQLDFTICSRCAWNAMHGAPAHRGGRACEQRADEAHPIELDIAEDARWKRGWLGEGCITRAVENAISMRGCTNEQGCDQRRTGAARRPRKLHDPRERRRCWNRELPTSPRSKRLAPFAQRRRP